MGWVAISILFCITAAYLYALYRQMRQAEARARQAEERLALTRLRLAVGNDLWLVSHYAVQQTLPASIRDTFYRP